MSIIPALFIALLAATVPAAEPGRPVLIKTGELTWETAPSSLPAGAKLDAGNADPLKEGGFHHLPGKAHHFAFMKAATVVQISGEGPFDIHYLDPADDPSTGR